MVRTPVPPPPTYFHPSLFTKSSGSVRDAQFNLLAARVLSISSVVTVLLLFFPRDETEGFPPAPPLPEDAPLLSLERRPFRGSFPFAYCFPLSSETDELMTPLNRSVFSPQNGAF